ncbi:hypothetical protein AB1Y20_006652 [Prymnesium parvum]|uniref:Uncharacterized protein n=1 Tax=Prymnesium parvum TaxID=97485 RepID=A0AB34J172_PRYPA
MNAAPLLLSAMVATPPAMPAPSTPPPVSHVTLAAHYFVPYHTYVGNLTVNGTVGPMTTSGTSQTFAYSLTGVDPACSSGAGPAANSCGVHIHSGMSCTSDAGGHYYTGSVTSDPWTSVSYTSTGAGTASASVTVDTGASSLSLVGRAFVVHGYDGGRIACALLGTGARATLSASGFMPYYTYSGNLSVGGTVGPMTTSGTSQTFAYSLTGVDPACSSGAGPASNSCGVHIHSGMTCTSDAGGHYYTGSVTSDPWTSVSYTSTGAGTASASVTVDTGAESGQIAGRAFVVHGYDGGRIACAILGEQQEVTLTASGLMPYYTYEGDLSVGGTIGPMTTSGTSQTFAYSLTGVDPACSSGAGPAANSCGVHIHSGMSCTSDAGGHYYTGSVTSDPWTSVSYTSTGAGTASASVTVDTGASSLSLIGRAFVVHGYDGGRIACALLGTGARATLSASGFMPYYTYSGNLSVGGTVGPMTTSGTSQTFAYSLTGVDPACSSGAGPAANSCGVHIHSGMTCTSDAGGHYYTGSVTSDPWTSVSYTSTGAGTASASVTVDTGAESGQIVGRAFVVHGYDGGRIACAILGEQQEVTLTASGLMPYYTYEGDLSVGGTIGPMTTSGTSQTFAYSLTGVDPACSSGAGPAANSCGVHIHSGMSCTSDAGGHYYTGSVTSDPWTSVSYTSTGAGTASASVTVDTGASSLSLIGRAFVVHGYDGGRIACALLGTGARATLSASGFMPYYTYSGNLSVGGTVGPMTTSGTSQTFAYSLTGVDPACSSGAGPAANSCGVHIHSGMTCTSDAGGHYYTGSVTSDPWTSVSYTSTGAGTASASVTVDTGAESGQIAGRAFVVHGYDGGRIACAILGEQQEVTLTASGLMPYYTYEGDLSVGGTIGPMTTSGTSQTFAYSLTGVDPACSSGAGPAANSCGVHIHSGMSCTSDAGGHYYTGSVTSDPWTSVSYTSTGAGTASASVTVDTGASSLSLIGRAFVVHGYDGGRIACALLGTGARATLSASGFMPYYTYSGNLSVGGTVGPMTTSGTSQTFAYSLTGVDPACSSGAGPAANSCGVHIHSGMTCTSDAGGHYYTGSVTSDPWTSVSYTSTGAGTASASVTVDTGAESGQIAGRAFVVHGYDGGRIACAILGEQQEVTLTASGLMPYYTYEGDLSVGGTIGPMTTSGTSQTFAYSLTGVDPACSSGAGPAANSCGVHIHSGMSCTSDAGGHYYTGSVTSDPWTSVSYTSTGVGTASASVTVDTGASSLSLIGRAFVVHGYDGGRIACALLGTGARATLSASGFMPYYTYSGNLSVGGTVGPMTTSGTSQTFAYSLTGVDPACSSGAGPAANSCGVHIHSGMTCTSDAGGHYYTGSVTSDPWTSVSYTSTGAGTASASVTVDTGAESGQIAGRAFVVHGYDGGRIACAILGEQQEVTLTASGLMPYYTYEGDLSVGGTIGPMTTSGTSQTFAYSLTGVDPACSSGAGPAANSCGVHIHSGMSCTSDAGGHYYTGSVTSDPWTSVSYTSTGAGTASASVTVDTGASSLSLIGRAFVVHGYDGGRIACALLGTGARATLSASGFMPYYTYSGNLSVGGTVGPMTTSGTSQTFAYSLTGVDPACSSGAGPAANSCGVHIHSGMTCTSDAGGHYYTGSVTSDPWTSVSYTSTGAGTASASVTVDTGAESGQIAGRAFVVHGYDGGRIACAILGEQQEVTLTASGLMPYYTYEGDLSVGGTIGPMTTSGTSQTFAYSLTGVDPACSSGAGPAANSCGVHIHSGMSCTSDAGGHYYTGSVTSDPWTSGRAFVVHGYDGGRIACALLGTGARATLSASGFMPYYTYSGNLSVGGTVGPMTTSGTSQTFAYSLTGVDPACSSGAGPAANSCGVHIHSGMTCTSDAGGHYYTGSVTSDPWTSVSYTSTGAGTASASVTVDTGAESGQIAGRAFVVHGYDGGRIACAILGEQQEVTLTASGLMPYYTYEGDLSVGGTIGPMTTSGTSQTFAYSLTGVDPACSSGAGPAANSCGVHIHSGMSCTSDAGGHYYTGSVTSDPWTSVSYTSTGAGTASASVTVDTGASSLSLIGRAFVVHGYDGGRIACALLGTGARATLSASGFMPYYTYSGNLSVGGTVGPMTTSGTSQTFAYSLTGVDPACSSGAGPAANSCGVHIHSGMTCTSDAGGHYYTGSVTSDPWTSVSYTSTGAGTASASVTVDTGAESGQIAGRAFVVHGYDGGRIACAILGEQQEVTLTASGLMPYYTYEGDLSVGGTIGPMTTSGTSQTFAYSLTGVDPACSSGAGPAANSCGVHIHSGMSCTSDAGGHYYTGSVTSDPWTSVSYTSTGAGTASASVTVDTGASSLSLIGRAFVVHGYDGGRIACALLGTGARATLSASGFMPYYTYSGNLSVGGTVGPMTTSGTSQTFAYSLTGVDPACSSGAGPAANSCGVHIHSGMTCTSDAGGHYYTGSVTSDPWTSIAGRAFVVHGYDGGRIACAILGEQQEVTLTASGLMPYYTYEGDLSVGGTIGPMTTSGTSQTFAYSLTGVDPACSSGAGPAANSCGVHIHSGMSCTSDAGGHYYTGSVTSDPWTSVSYTSTGAGTASASVTVDTGASSLSLIGRAFVVHGYDGGRIACALLGTGARATLSASGFMPYYTYSGNLSVGGTVGPMTTSGTSQTFAYSLTGVDPACSSGAGPAANSCGVHIHSGMTCTSDAGGHYYTGSVTSDPWTSVSYTSTGAGTASASVTVDTGAESGQIAGRAFVVHGYDGGRIACAILGEQQEVTLTASGLMPYYTYEGDLSVGGTIGPMTTSGTSQTFAYSLTGVDPACSSGAGPAANSCGVHIHSGMSCTSDAGGHYYTGSVTSDPWTSVSYTSTGAGTASASVTVDTGASSLSLIGRAFVVHGYDGGRIACALLGTGARATLSASGFMPYYTYSGNLSVGGTVGPMTTSGTSQTFAYSLTGVDPACSSGAGPAANSCGVHIHSGMTCTSDAGGHYYTGSVTSDPWTSVSYTSTGAGTASASVTVDTGAESGQIAGRAFVVHGYDGGRIACAILGEQQEVTLTASGLMPYYTYEGDLSVGGTIGPMTTSETSQTFAYSLTGVDPACSSGAGPAANSCGVHIHSGMSCTSDAGGHYYTGSVTSDPWTSVSYTSTGAGTASASVTVDTGASSLSLIGRAFVVHGYDGGRIACALLGTGARATLSASGFMPYYTYSGNLSVGGTVGPMTTSGTSQTFAYSLTGVDPACSSGAGPAANSCGVHIHSGMTCTSDAGGHYYTGSVTSDPWTSVSYTSTGAGTASASVTVDTGAESGQIAGRAFVVHGYDGGRIACAILGEQQEVTLTASGLMPYYTYEGDLSVGGTVGPMTTSGTSQTFAYSLTGVDPACSSGAGPAANSCGVHIHSGMSCTSDAGGHYYTGSVTSDPWTSVSYTSTGAGTASASVTVDTGASSLSLIGRAFVVHGYDGGRIACALLGTGARATLSASGFMPYYTYSGNLSVGGTVGPMTTSGTSQTFAYSLTGVDPACSSGAGPAANSCGVHIHSGMTCTSDAGGHYYTGSVTSDPWTSVSYTSTGAGTASASVTVDTGAESGQIAGRAFVVHGYDGGRIAWYAVVGS